MPKFKATKKFKELGTENSYQHLETEQFFALQRGETVEMKALPFRARFLLFDKFIERLPEKPDDVFSKKHLDGMRKLTTNKNVKGA